MRSAQSTIDAASPLVESETRFRIMADCAPVMLWMSGTDGNCTFFNRGWLEFTGRAMEQELGVGWAESVLAEDFARCMDTYLDAFVVRRAFRMEYRMRRADGVYRWILDQGVPRFAPGGAFEGYIGSCIDVTELREAHEATERNAAELERRVADRTSELQKALGEREVLLREIHHRVKNNLQLMTSLFRLQARQLTGSARVFFEEAQNRVHSIGLLHEHLYGAHDLSAVEFGEYARGLVAAIAEIAGRAEVRLTVDAEDVLIGVDQAIPCGLILNELLTNALRHAFPAGRGGTVEVRLRRHGLETFELTVSDDGVGLPDHVDVAKSSTLGLELVYTLICQLRGSLALTRDAGTVFHISCPLGARS
jgi:PAS domain S-box-containing protein